MVTNNTGWRTHYLQGKYGGLGLLMSPDGLRGPYPHLPYALDNGAFPAWANGKEWDQRSFEKGLEWGRKQNLKPRWVVVPDVVTEAEATIERWHDWAPRMANLGFKLALAVQDGMTAQDAQTLNPDVIFVGGTKLWKMQTLSMWCAEFPRVHVGRINGLAGLMACHAAGAESVDGTGFFRGSRTQLGGLIKYIEAYGDNFNHPMYQEREHSGQGGLYE